MTSQDLADIQTQLNSVLPESYIEFILSDAPKLKDVFYEPTLIIEANLAARKECWKGEPLDQFFYVFGKDEKGLMLLMDLDLTGGAVMRQDNTPLAPSHRAQLLSPTFKQRLKQSN